MFSAHTLRRSLAVPGALLVSVALTGVAAAVTWDAPKALATGVDVFQGDLASAGGNAVAVFGTSDPDEEFHGFRRRPRFRRLLGAGRSAFKQRHPAGYRSSRD